MIAKLIDQLADRTVLLTPEGAIRVHGGYTTAHGERTLRCEAREHKAQQLRRQVKKLENEFRQRMSWGHRKEASKRGAGAQKPFIARRAKKMIKRAKEVEKRHSQKLEALNEQAPRRKRPVKIEVVPYPVANRHVVTLDGVERSFGDNKVLKGIDLKIDCHDRLFLIGRNGAGKSTLLRLLLDSDRPSSGLLLRNNNMRIGYLPQSLNDSTTPFFTGDTLFESLPYGPPDKSEAPQTVAGESEIRTMLAAVGLRRERVNHPLDQLSHGERMRAALVFLIAQRFDFLVLDEPTSHIDLETIEVLESVLTQLPCGYLVVSHDRRLIESCAETLFSLEDGRLVRL